MTEQFTRYEEDRYGIGNIDSENSSNEDSWESIDEEEMNKEEDDILEAKIDRILSLTEEEQIEEFETSTEESRIEEMDIENKRRGNGKVCKYYPECMQDKRVMNLMCWNMPDCKYRHPAMICPQ